MTVAPYGSWTSPITAADLAASGHPVSGACFVGSDVWWAEGRPTERGRTAIRRAGVDGEPVDILEAPFDARTRVHEYGGGAWAVTEDARLVYAEYSDQRLYVVEGGHRTALTPDTNSQVRYGDLSVRDHEVWCVRESHDDEGTIVRDIVAIGLDGASLRSVVSGSDFLAYPRVSPDGTRLAWIAWNHPQMPWDGTELRVAPLGVDGVAGEWVVLAGGADESVLQPEWTGSGQVLATSDRSGWWNLYTFDVDAGEPQSVGAVAADIGAPLWQLGAGWYLQTGDATWLTVRTSGTDTLARLDTTTGVFDDIDLGDHTSIGLLDIDGPRVLLRTAGAQTPGGIRILDLGSGELEDVRLSLDDVPPEQYLPVAQQVTFDGPKREVHAVVYPPRNPDQTGPDGELPPYIAFVHGGPTAHVAPRLDPVYAFFTSRGYGVVDVNYGGSSGYGREYRNRLRGQWGIVDVEDTVVAVEGLADLGLADRARLAIEGGSAGGWTVLAALTSSDVFACGASYYGVAELEKFVAETHDFESRYIDGLIGPLPEAAELYRSRAPLNNVDGLSCPVLLLQGLNDPIVPPAQAERFRDALVAKGIPHRYIAYEGESHGFRKVETIIDARESELTFYREYL
ncbi:S9 family peptidase [Gordonia rubripertincta]|uniref:Prolyl oligopeptidase family serine peptidase n=1 Tax=Gordonia rubripertincta TaxID=36822 RepID=A0ABT4MSW7_GORRU|nr:prolyl oligopeptidase family serine peptidase [Gordonia rubripertincta]MCZ4550085.1 prolyl oligopeptidase family serine peptidase [Gordonia rubripertincta]